MEKGERIVGGLYWTVEASVECSTRDAFRRPPPPPPPPPLPPRPTHRRRHRRGGFSHELSGRLSNTVCTSSLTRMMASGLAAFSPHLTTGGWSLAFKAMAMSTRAGIDLSRATDFLAFSGRGCGLGRARVVASSRESSPSSSPPPLPLRQATRTAVTSTAPWITSCLLAKEKKPRKSLC